MGAGCAGEWLAGAGCARPLVPWPVAVCRPRRSQNCPLTRSNFTHRRFIIARWLDRARYRVPPGLGAHHLQPVFQGCEVVGGVADDLFAHGLCLPSGSNTFGRLSTSLSDVDRCRGVEAIRSLHLNSWLFVACGPAVAFTRCPRSARVGKRGAGIGSCVIIVADSLAVSMPLRRCPTHRGETPKSL